MQDYDVLSVDALLYKVLYAFLDGGFIAQAFCKELVLPCSPFQGRLWEDPCDQNFQRSRICRSYCGN